jgi:hypothetical protein
MAALSLQTAPSLPATTSRYRGFRSWLQRPSFDEVRVLLIALAALVCLLVLASVRSSHSLDERAMLSAMFAAGGMPLIYCPSALCRVPNQHARFDHGDILTLLRN